MFVGPPPLSLSCVHVARGWMSRQLWYWQVTIVHYWTSPQLWFPTNKTLERLNGFSRPRELPVTSSLHSSILSAIIYTCHGIASKEAFISYSHVSAFAGRKFHSLAEIQVFLLMFKLKTKHFLIHWLWPSHESCTNMHHSQAAWAW